MKKNHDFRRKRVVSQRHQSSTPWTTSNKKVPNHRSHAKRQVRVRVSAFSPWYPSIPRKFRFNDHFRDLAQKKPNSAIAAAIPRSRKTRGSANVYIYDVYMLPVNSTLVCAPTGYVAHVRCGWCTFTVLLIIHSLQAKFVLASAK